MNKTDTILAALKSGKSLNRFDAEALGDHCLHSTISRLCARGHKIIGDWERVPTRFGTQVRVKRYRCVGAGRKQR